MPAHAGTQCIHRDADDSEVSAQPATTPDRGLQVKGTLISSRVEFVRSRGEFDFRRWLERLSPEARAVAEQPVLVNLWYDFDVFVELSVSIDALFGLGDLQMCRDLAARTLDKYSGTIYRFALRALSLEQLSKRAVTTWRVHYSEGEVQSDTETLPDGRTRTVVRLVGLSRHHPAHCQSVRGWIHRAGELTHARDIDESCVSCARRGDAGCAWSFTYR